MNERKMSDTRERFGISMHLGRVIAIHYVDARTSGRELVGDRDLLGPALERAEEYLGRFTDEEIDGHPEKKKLSAQLAVGRTVAKHYDNGQFGKIMEAVETYQKGGRR